MRAFLLLRYCLWLCHQQHQRIHINMGIFQLYHSQRVKGFQSAGRRLFALFEILLRYIQHRFIAPVHQYSPCGPSLQSANHSTAD